MKKILFNGCSFVAGDALAWDEYLKENNLPYADFTGWLANTSIKISSLEKSKIYDYYRNFYRRSKNLPALVGNRLGVEVIDLSQDGNSNDCISMSTILKILEIPKEDRKDMHVIIGWSESSRRMRYLKEVNSFFNLHANHYDQRHSNSWVRSLLGYLTHGIIMADQHDHYINYVKNIMVLENFLKANGIKYTFYRSLGTPFDCIYNKLDNIIIATTILDHPVEKSNLTDNTCWYKFNTQDQLAFEGSSVIHEYMFNDLENTAISPDNGHPNLALVNKIADNLAEFIKLRLS